MPRRTATTAKPKTSKSKSVRKAVKKIPSQTGRKKVK